MDNQHLLEVFSVIEKEEFISTLDHDILPNTFVLEITHPFPGYYGNDFITQNTKPNTVFLLLKESLKVEVFLRIVRKIRHYTHDELDAALAEVFIQNQNYHSIRLRNLEKYSEILEFQHYFNDEGLNFLKPKKLEGIANIKINKVLNLQKVSSHIYLDKEDKDFVYFEIPDKMNWKFFESITKRIKLNNRQYHFDAATGYLFLKHEITDVIRIYSDDCNIEKINKIRDLYLNEIEKH